MKYVTYKGKKIPVIVVIVLIIAALLSWYLAKVNAPQPVYSESVQNVPPFSTDPFVVINNNEPEFTELDITADSYEYYSPLDPLGRCGYTIACIGYDLMPTEDRESISSVKPTGWVQNEYDIVDGKSLYNRCHLIGFQLTGENANEKNLITGTRYCNVEGMLPFENMVADYIKETHNHVLYRVTPVFEGNDLVARGVQMEAWSVEDSGAGICYNVYVYNCQPGITIDYATGRNWEESGSAGSTSSATGTYILNTNSGKFHMQDCPQGESILENNKEIFTGDREELIRQGYKPSGCCDP